METNLTEKQLETIKTNLEAFEFHYGRIDEIHKWQGYLKGCTILIQEREIYCENIDYLNGWLYGCVQGRMILRTVK